MENYIRKILQGFIRFQYSDSLTKQIHHWLIGKENADLKEQALKEIWDTTEAKQICRLNYLLVMYYSA